MDRWHNYYVDGMIHFCTATVDGWLPLLDDRAVAVLYHELDSARRLFGVRVLAYVVMPEHIHLLVWSESGENVKKFVQRVLSRSSKRIKRGGKLWKERCRVVPLYSRPVIQTKLDYIHANPIRRGLVSNAEDWPHSSFAQLEMGRTTAAFQCDSWPEGALIL